MVRVAIVEDEKEQALILQNNLVRYGKEHDIEFAFSLFNNPLPFLNNYKANYDIVFMDIKMEMMDGMKASELLREKDRDVILIFVTSLMQYAVKGYKVRALDFLVKPVKYYDLSLTMIRCLETLKKNRDQKYLLLNINGENKKVSLDDIHYIEVLAHDLTIHLEGNNEIHTRMTLKDIMLKIDSSSFALCNSCYLVNLKYVDSIDKYKVKLGNDVLSISHPKRHDFVEAFKKFSVNN